jgi:hypothetical protein
MCDATYVPPNVYEKIPFIDLKNGYRVIHPLYQKIDQHMLMSKLYTDPPRESYQNRIKKDLTRYNLLDEFYPVEPVKERVKLFKVKISNDIFPVMDARPTILHGYCAYAALIQTAKTMLNDKWADVQRDKDIIITEAYFENETYIFETAVDAIHLLIEDPEDSSRPKNFDSYEPLLDLVPDKWISNNIELWRFTGILISAGIGKVGDIEIILPSVQYVLMFLLTMYYFGDEKNKNINLLLYCSLRKLLVYLEPIYTDEDKSPFFIPTQTIGSINISQSNMIILMRIKQNLGESEPGLLCLPPNYWPASSNMVKNYDYDTCQFFCKGGRKN